MRLRERAALREGLRPRTLRSRLLLIVSGLLLAALAVFAAVSIAILRQNLVAQAETALYLSAENTATQLMDALDADGRVPVYGAEYGPTLSPDAFSVVVGADGGITSTYLSRDYDIRPLTADEVALLRAAAEDPKGRETVVFESIGEFVISSMTIETEGASPVLLISGVGLNEADAVVGVYGFWMGALGVGVALLAVLVGHRIVQSALRPLERVAAVADRVAQTPLDSGEVARQGRVPRDARHAGSEADRVAETLNRLLDHVESSLNTRHRTEESMRRFIAEASHELRNPLASIRGYADFYAQPGADAAETAGALGRIGAEARRMSGLVDDLLLLAKLDADPQVRHEEVELSRLVVEAVADARFAHPDHVWRLGLRADAAEVIGDEDAIRQMLLNLIANAGHHTPPGTEVAVLLTETDDGTELSVSDNGPGIPKAALPTLFDRFTQVEDTTEHGTRERTTVGLGLAIVRALADASGYRVTVDTSAAGTRFTVVIPRT
ncbi:two-component system OmpR family sensor kinase [Microbacterium resistens]|uniref:histidine kinase n=1 Tax=Microbacterium resistens TaxID=156977 RepID=A0ABU1SBY0_9MICO|nr:HAMP domain-containing sensor histidine kinase [Microbacterium resistens]MDR6867064.1 two-component system OmpR family sensor kinase [Microbacterium resistens]